LPARRSEAGNEYSSEGLIARPLAQLAEPKIVIIPTIVKGGAAMPGNPCPSQCSTILVDPLQIVVTASQFQRTVNSGRLAADRFSSFPGVMIHVACDDKKNGTVSGT
jgi:hypothetical protein